MATFKTRTARAAIAESPERLFDNLPRMPGSAPSLWAHQADMLRSYVDAHVATADLALELPTGAGKTLPALLVAEWRRTSFQERAAYACPTVQLAHQVAAEGARQGIAVVTLVGSHHAWHPADRAKYEGAKAVAITTYKALFNSNPAVTDPKVILFDDAHAAEGEVASAWSVGVDRATDANLYAELLDVAKRELPALVVRRLVEDDPDPLVRRAVHLLPLAAVERLAGELDTVLARLPSGTDLAFRYAMIREQVDRCLVYVSWEGILVRPFIAPTHTHAVVAQARQRLYLSATLGASGELERAFGRTPIQRLPIPPGWDRRGSGRRFFLFPELMRGTVPTKMAAAVLQETKKALVIAPSGYQLDRTLDAVVPDGVAVFGKKDIEQSLAPFAKSTDGVLALANRYDGIDLPGDACRLVILSGSPTGAHLQERFLVSTLRASRVLEERIRTRVVQGAGRCTRGMNDHSLVVVLGDDLTMFLAKPEVKAALRPEVQAEIEFGWMNAEQATATDLLDNVRSFVSQDDAWIQQAEPEIALLRQEATVQAPAGSDQLATSSTAEVRASQHAWDGRWEAASKSAVHAASTMTDPLLKPYAAFWTYLASRWLARAADETADEAKTRAAAALLDKAHTMSRGTTWLRELEPAHAATASDPLDDVAVRAAAAGPTRTMSEVKFAKATEDMLQGLQSNDHRLFEPALSRLGSMLGAEAFKPAGKGRADSAWLFGDQWWVTIEAKNEVTEGGAVSMADLRQANTQLDLLAADREGQAPPESASVIVSPKLLVDPDAVKIARTHVYLADIREVVTLAQRAVRAWSTIRTVARASDEDKVGAIVAEQFGRQGITATQIREQLTSRRVAA